LIPFIKKTGFVDHQHAIIIAQIFHHILAQVVADLVCAPHGGSEGVLRGIWSFVPSFIRHLPTILPLDRAEQSMKVRQRPLAQFGGREPLADLIVDFSEPLSPGTRLTHSKRLLSLCSVHHDPS
jgi:hypothetical protein